MFDVGPLEGVMLLAIALLVLGPRRLPEAARSLGRGVREFKQALQGSGEHEVEETAPEADTPRAPPAEPSGSIDVEQTCAALEAIAVGLGPDAPARAVDAVLRYEPVGREELGVTLDLRGDGAEPASPPDLVIRTPPEVAHRFWAGLVHEPAEILSGNLIPEGPLSTTLRVLPPLRALGELYCESVGVGGPPPVRFEVPRATAVDPEALPSSLPARVEGREGRAACAAAIVAGLPPVDRSIEIAAIVRGVLEGVVTDEDLGCFLACLDVIGGAGNAARQASEGHDARMAAA
jgi:TatA/E family protein of Tat protein translocase